MKRVALCALVAIGCAAIVAQTYAADKNDPSGTWKWSVSFNNQSRDVTLKLKLDGDKLTGTISGRNNQESKIEDGKFKDSELSFTVTRERNGQKFSTKYKGKIDGDAIKGKIEFERNGQTNSRDWEAKREKA